MPLRRRQFLAGAGLLLTGGAFASVRLREDAPPDWADVRDMFGLDQDVVHMSAMLIASHPRPVREAIEEYRRSLDENPTLYLQEHNRRRRDAVRQAGGRYCGVDASEIALTDSTTMGVGLIYNGLQLRSGQEIVTTVEDYFVTHEAVRQATERTGATGRRIELFEEIATVSADALVEAVARELRPETRVLGLTWVHSSTGLKLPLARIAEAVAEANAGREDEDRILLVVDGVHGFGVEDATLPDLGCDYFAAGCHKWLFGPRGTGIAWARGSGWALTRPSIPSFADDGTWEAWLNDEEPGQTTDGDRMTPGGFKAFEHQWAMVEAFELHRRIGKARVAERTHALATQLKEGLAGMDHVELITPASPELSSGIVSFLVDGMDPRRTVRRLRDRGIIASVSPYATRHARLTPSIRNTAEEVDTALREIRDLA